MASQVGGGWFTFTGEDNMQDHPNRSQPPGLGGSNGPNPESPRLIPWADVYDSLRAQLRRLDMVRESEQAYLRRDMFPTIRERRDSLEENARQWLAENVRNDSGSTDPPTHNNPMTVDEIVTTLEARQPFRQQREAMSRIEAIEAVLPEGYEGLPETRRTLREKKVGLRSITPKRESVERHIDLIQCIDGRSYIVGDSEDITLGETNFGVFEIRIPITPDMYVQCIARTPNPAIDSSTCTHPHVRSDKLCLGQAKQPLARAVVSGNFLLALDIVNSVLQTYNSDSPHRQLEGWNGFGVCEDCESVLKTQLDTRGCGVCDKQKLCRRCRVMAAFALGYVCYDCGEECAECGRIARPDEMHESGGCQHCNPDSDLEDEWDYDLEDEWDDDLEDAYDER